MLNALLRRFYSLKFAHCCIFMPWLAYHTFKLTFSYVAVLHKRWVSSTLDSPLIWKFPSAIFLCSIMDTFQGKCRWVATGKYLLNSAHRPKALERPIFMPRLGFQNNHWKKVCLLNIAIILIPSRLSQETFKFQKKQDQQFSRHHLLSRHLHPHQPCRAKYSASSSTSRAPSPSSSNSPSSSSWPSVS